MNSAILAPRVVAAIIVGCVMLRSAAALAEPPRDFPVEKFEPAPAGDALMVSPDPDVKGALRVSAGLVVDYALNPLVVVQNGADGQRSAQGSVVSHLAVSHLLASVSLLDRFKLSVDLPAALVQSGESPAWGAESVPSPDGANLLDLRLDTMLTLIHQDKSLPAVSLLGRIWFPTGDETQFGGAGITRYDLGFSTGADYATWLWRFSMLRRYGHGPSDASGALLGDEGLITSGAAYKIGNWQAGIDLYGSTVIEPADAAFARPSTNLEALGSGRWSHGPLSVSLAAGPGLASGLGTPQFRAVLGVAFTPVFIESSPESSRVGQSNGNDVAEHIDQHRTDAQPTPQDIANATAKDSDRDGVPDADDQCPSIPGSAEPNAPKLGCPPDKDGDGIGDARDDCPSEAGVASTVPGRYGCPLDQDADGIVDSQDACPRDKGPKTEDPKTNGCPTSVSIQGQQVVVLQRIRFATGSDVLAPSSIPTLQQVRDLLLAHPELARLAVEGHTDNVGAVRSNLDLSRRRAVSVVRWLVSHGVDERRLEARGYGPKRPVASNATPDGRAKNRRVTFVVLRRTTRGSRGWQSGAVEAPSKPGKH